MAFINGVIDSAKAEKLKAEIAGSEEEVVSPTCILMRLRDKIEEIVERHVSLKTFLPFVPLSKRKPSRHTRKLFCEHGGNAVRRGGACLQSRPDH